MVYTSNARMSPVKPSKHTTNNYYATMKEIRKQILARNKHITKKTYKKQTITKNK